MAENMTTDVLELLRCPVCGSDIAVSDTNLDCTDSSCGISFPVVNDVPVLINESRSLFSLDDYRQFQAEPESSAKQHPIARFLNAITPDINANGISGENYEKFEGQLSNRPDPKILVIGGQVTGQGMEEILNRPDLKFVETDVGFGPRTQMICDAHDIPFQDGSFDGVIVQAVLEHVVDPYRCVAEIHRVLKPDGVVYAETPFIQQVHMGRYDFTRFTDLGHRRLFRNFDEIESGASCGPGMALAWSYSYFMASLADAKRLRFLLVKFAHFTSFYLKYFDRFLLTKQGGLDAASSYYFLGVRSDETLSDRELITRYRGMQQ